MEGICPGILTIANPQTMSRNSSENLGKREKLSRGAIALGGGVVDCMPVEAISMAMMMCENCRLVAGGASVKVIMSRSTFLGNCA